MKDIKFCVTSLYRYWHFRRCTL